MLVENPLISANGVSNKNALQNSKPFNSHKYGVKYNALGFVNASSPNVPCVYAIITNGINKRNIANIISESRLHRPARDVSSEKISSLL